MQGLDIGQFGLMVAVAGVIIMPVVIIRLAKQLKKVQEMKEGSAKAEKSE